MMYEGLHFIISVESVFILDRIGKHVIFWLQNGSIKTKLQKRPKRAKNRLNRPPNAKIRKNGLKKKDFDR
jgi:hypothetical protein